LFDGKGTAHALLKDRELSDKINRTITNIEDGTRSFNETMGAIKHSFLFRGYFKKLEQKKQSEANQVRY
jgi:phospholipid/cholesterol/gamma-HCH transport system substrate-binding protein